MRRFSLAARSLSGCPASLRSVPEGAASRIGKALIWRVMLSFARWISGVVSIFLPALREARMGVIAVEWYGSTEAPAMVQPPGCRVAAAHAPPERLIAAPNRQPGGPP